MSTAKILELKLPEISEHPATCDQCVHFMTGYLGQFCRAYEEDIFSVHEAVNCDDYEGI